MTSAHVIVWLGWKILQTEIYHPEIKHSLVNVTWRRIRTVVIVLLVKVLTLVPLVKVVILALLVKELTLVLIVKVFSRDG